MLPRRRAVPDFFFSHGLRILDAEGISQHRSGHPITNMTRGKETKLPEDKRVPSRQPYTGGLGTRGGTRARTGLWGSIKKSHVLHLRVVRGRDAPHHRRELLARRRLVQRVNVRLDHIFYGILPQDAGRELLA